MSDTTTPPPSLDPTTELPFPTALDPVQVPPGHFPIEVVQFWRGEYRRGHPLPLHWSILVRTAAHRGNTHEIVGDMNTFATQDRFDVLLGRTAGSSSSSGGGGGGGNDDWRGSHVVGHVSPNRLDDLLNHIALVPVVRHRWGWNCQNWVYDVLAGLRDPDMYADATLTFGKLQTQMRYLLEAWEVGDI